MNHPTKAAETVLASDTKLAVETILTSDMKLVVETVNHPMKVPDVTNVPLNGGPSGAALNLNVGRPQAKISAKETGLQRKRAEAAKVKKPPPGPRERKEIFCFEDLLKIVEAMKCVVDLLSNYRCYNCDLNFISSTCSRLREGSKRQMDQPNREYLTRPEAAFEHSWH